MGNRHLGWLVAGIAVASIATAVADDVLGLARGSSVKGSSLTKMADRLRLIGLASRAVAAS